MSFKKLVTFFSLWQVQLVVLLIHIFIGLIGLYSFIFNFNLTENYLTQNAEDKQAIIAKSGARSVEDFLNSLENQLFSLIFSFEKINENAEIDKENVRKEFSRYVNQAKAPISGIALYDETGKLLIIENTKGITLGENNDYSNEEFIKWSKQPESKDKIFITAPFLSKSGASNGKIIMAVVTPLYFGNHYKGTIAIRFLIDQFKEAFINPLTSDLEEETMIVDISGRLIAGDNQLVNKNLIDYAKERRWNGYEEFISKFNSVIQKQQTKTSWNFQFPDSQRKVFLVAASKIDVPNTDNDLYLIISTNLENSTKALSPIRSYGSIWAALSIVFTLLGGIIYIILRYFSSKD